MEVPRGGDTDVVVAVVIPVVVDIQTVSIKVADVNTVAVRIHVICLSSSVSLGIELYCPFGLICSFPCILFGSR